LAGVADQGRMRNLLKILSISAGLLCVSTSTAFAHETAHRSRSTRCKVSHHAAVSHSCRPAHRTIRHTVRLAAPTAPARGKVHVKAPAPARTPVARVTIAPVTPVATTPAPVVTTPAPVVTTPAPVVTTPAPVTPVTGSGAGNGSMLFDGTFNTGLTNYTDQFFTPGSLTEINSNEEEYDITSADNPAGNGHYRGDLSSSNIYPAGTPECTTIPIQFNNGLAAVSNSSWLQVAETKDSTASLAGWGMVVSSYYGGQNEFGIEFNGYASDAPAWTSGPIDTGIHTLSICTNDASDSSGEVYGIWFDGVRQTFNHGSSSGSQSLSGFAIIDDGASSWPLDINDYTGGTTGNQLIHGAPLVTTMGSNDLPPQPAGGWNSF